MLFPSSLGEGPQNQESQPPMLDSSRCLNVSGRPLFYCTHCLFGGPPRGCFVALR
ncbi:hypothetical protein CSKR_106819, partial [Clonorchis sinensis]